MSNVKTSDESAAAPLSGTELVRIVQSGANAKTTARDIANLATGAYAVYVGSSPPGAPYAGQLWWNEVDGNMKIYYDDGDTQQWVDSVVGLQGPTGSTGLTGATGTAGTTGAIGATGATGATFFGGPTGTTGSTGAAASVTGTGFVFATSGAIDSAAKTATAATAVLNSVVGDSGSGGTKGLVPAPGAGDAAAGKFLKADGTFAVPPGSGGGGANSTNGFRLTLTTAVPVATSDVTGATTIYCTPYKGNQIGLYNGATWDIVASAEFSLALGTLTSGKNYDVFCYNNSGTATLEFLAWTSDTARATALVMQDGILCKTGALTRRYLGTFRTTSTTATEDSGGGTTTQVGGKRFLWNCYHRCARPVAVFDSTALYSYTTNTWRQQNGASGNRIEVVRGLDEDVVTVAHQEMVNHGGGARGGQISIGVDSTTTPTNVAGTFSNSAVNEIPVTVFYSGFPGLGYHALNCLEKGGSTVCNFGIDATGQPVTTGVVFA